MKQKRFVEDNNKKTNTNTNQFVNSISMRGKTPDEVFLDLLSGEPDDLSPDFFDQ
jgi:hypothetical protein